MLPSEALGQHVVDQLLRFLANLADHVFRILVGEHQGGKPRARREQMGAGGIGRLLGRLSGTRQIGPRRCGDAGRRVRRCFFGLQPRRAQCLGDEGPLGLHVGVAIVMPLRCELLLEHGIALAQRGVGPQCIAKTNEAVPGTAVEHHQVQVVGAVPVRVAHQRTLVGERLPAFDRCGVAAGAQLVEQGVGHGHGGHAAQNVNDRRRVEVIDGGTADVFDGQKAPRKRGFKPIEFTPEPLDPLCVPGDELNGLALRSLERCPMVHADLPVPCEAVQFHRLRFAHTGQRRSRGARICVHSIVRASSI